MGCCKDGGCGGTYVPPTFSEDIENMKSTVYMMKVSNLFTSKEIESIEKAIESHGKYKELELK